MKKKRRNGEMNMNNKEMEKAIIYFRDNIRSLQKINMAGSTLSLSSIYQLIGAVKFLQRITPIESPYLHELNKLLNEIEALKNDEIGILTGILENLKTNIAGNKHDN